MSHYRELQCDTRSTTGGYRVPTAQAARAGTCVRMQRGRWAATRGGCVSRRRQLQVYSPQLDVESISRVIAPVVQLGQYPRKYPRAARAGSVGRGMHVKRSWGAPGGTAHQIFFFFFTGGDRGTLPAVKHRRPCPRPRISAHQSRSVGRGTPVASVGCRRRGDVATGSPRGVVAARRRFTAPAPSGCRIRLNTTDAGAKRPDHGAAARRRGWWPRGGAARVRRSGGAAGATKRRGVGATWAEKRRPRRGATGPRWGGAAPLQGRLSPGRGQL